MVGKKVIIPNCMGEWNIKYHLTGKQYDKDLSAYNFFSKQMDHFGTWYDWVHFEVKAFKKGTVHLKWKDLHHWQLFNETVAKIKGYNLPEVIK